MSDSWSNFWNDFEIMSDFFWWETDNSDVENDETEWLHAYLNLFKYWNNSFIFCNFFIIDEIFIFSNCFSICFELFLTCFFWILMKKENVVTFFLFLFFNVKNWLSDVWSSWKMIDDWELFKLLVLEKFSELFETKICNLNWLRLLMHDEFFMIEIESFFSRYDYCIIFEAECSIYFVDTLSVWFSSFCCLKFSLAFLMFLCMILNENMFRFFFDTFFQENLIFSIFNKFFICASCHF